MEDLLRIVILGIVQGLTEFLPISSDGHLIVVGTLYESLTGRKLEGEQITLTIALHAGTFVTVLVVFRKQVLRLLNQDRRVIPLLIVGTIPVGIFGLMLKKTAWGNWLINSPIAAGIGLVITGLILLWGTRTSEDLAGAGDDDSTTDRATNEANSAAGLGGDAGRIRYPQLSYLQTVIIGCFQAAAALPGVSRSGSTIASGLRISNLRREDAANFSFLLSIPAIGGAVFVECIELMRKGDAGGFAVGHLAIGAATAMLVGFIALRWLLTWVRGGRLHLFAYWCIPLGIIVTAWQMLAA
jgi:undecaprenyl-diphosphatase